METIDEIGEHAVAPTAPAIASEKIWAAMREQGSK